MVARNAFTFGLTSPLFLSTALSLSFIFSYYLLSFPPYSFSRHWIPIIPTSNFSYPPSSHLQSTLSLSKPPAFDRSLLPPIPPLLLIPFFLPLRLVLGGSSAFYFAFLWLIPLGLGLDPKRPPETLPPSGPRATGPPILVQSKSIVGWSIKVASRTSLCRVLRHHYIL